MSDPAYLDDMPDFPPVEYGDEDFYLPPDPYFGEDFAGIVDEPPDLWPPDPVGDDLPVAEPPFSGETWRWHDARLIGVVRDGDQPYEVGAIDVYADTASGDLGGSYLPVAAFAERDQAAAFFDELDDQIRREADTPSAMLRLLEDRAHALNPDPANWRAAGQAEYAAYDYVRGIDADTPPPDALDPLLEEAFKLGGVLTPDPAEAALAGIGLRVDHFDRQAPPAFYDEASDTRFWIGVFQPDADDRETCITAILSLAPDESGGLTAQLAPCAVGDWDTAYANAEFLIERAQNGGIERVFDAAEAMARGADQRELWQSERGLPLDDQSTRAVTSEWEAQIER